MSQALHVRSCRLDIDDIRAALRAHERRVDARTEYRRAAVLFSLMDSDAGWQLVLTRRNNDLPHHQGQIAFPGGSIDAGESPEEAALREAWEEVGLDSGAVTLLGLHDDIWTPSGFIITPVLGVISRDARFRINPAEVARVFSVPLCFFAEESNTERRIMRYRGVDREVLFYHYDGETIWGATALLISNVLSLLSLYADQR